METETYLEGRGIRNELTNPPPRRIKCMKWIQVAYAIKQKLLFPHFFYYFMPLPIFLKKSLDTSPKVYPLFILYFVLRN